MTGSLEKRKHERYDEEEDLLFSIAGLNKFNKGSLKNFSIGGMYFYSGYRINAGSNVSIKMLNNVSFLDARVIRCTQIADIPGKKFGIAVLYNNMK